MPPDDDFLPPDQHARLRAALRRLDGDPPDIPRALDERLRQAFQEQAAARDRRLAFRRRWARIGAAAALLLVGILTFALTSERPDPVREGRPDLPALRGDLDRDGRITILDAFSLARSLSSTDASDPRADQNGDGRLDEIDLDSLIQQAVAVNGGPR